jgi:phosphatidylglycerol:prolipoprotein diacylglycerol transferase
MLSFYQHLPAKIDPIAFSIGLFSVRWYSLMYLAAFLVVYGLLRWRVKNDIEMLKFAKHILDWMIFAVAGLLVGGRLGYVLFYNFGYYVQNPLSVISPYDFSTGVWTGIFGMSYFGGAIGVILASWIWTQKPVRSGNKIDFWTWADFVLPAIPAGYFFGRIGNFLNGELYGRITEKPWGMYFPIDFGLILRHPSQLYEALLEGVVIFIILWLMRNRWKYYGQALVAYLFFYAFFRFGIEFFRELDPGASLIFGYLTLGQVFCLVFMALAIFLESALSKIKKAV